jgi:hypothetical protein
MKTRKIRHDAWTSEQDKLVKSDLPAQDVANQLGRTVHSVYKRRKTLGWITAPPSAKPETTYAEDSSRAADAVWRQKYSILNRKYQKAVKENSLVTQLVTEIKEMAPTSYTASPAIIAVRKRGTSSKQSAMLLFSDTHIGKEVLPSQTLNFGCYNFDVFCARLKYLEESVISILENHTTMDVQELVIAMLGDMLDGALNHGVEAGLRNTLFTQYYNGGHAIAQFFRAIAAHVPKLTIKTVVGNHCVDEATEILTRRGWLHHTQLTLGDECLGLLADGKTAVWQPVDAIVREPQIDRMVSIQNRRFDFRGTEHHRFYYFIPGHPMLNEARWSEIDRSLPIQIPTAGYFKGTGAGVPDQYIELAAAVLTDGSISQSGDIVVYQHPKKENWVKEAFEKSGLAFTRRCRTRKAPESICGRAWKGGPTSAEVSYRLSSPAAREFLAATLLHKGELPHWVWNFTKPQFDRFLQALLLGDGTDASTKSPCLYGKSREFLGQVQALCALHGVTGGLAPYYPNNANPNPQYRLSLTYEDRVSLGNNAEIQTESSVGETVWCVRTASENFMCRRNGRAYFTGNTRWQNQHRMPTENRFSNLDMFLYALVEALTKDIPNIHWDLNQQPFTIFQVEGWTFYGAHGDHLRGGDKNLGIPNHAIGRQISTSAQLFAKHSRQAPHYYICGHLHREIKLPHALGDVTINGGFPGLDNYSLAENFNPVDPTQVFFFVHPRYGKTAEYSLSLKHAEIRRETTTRPYQLPDAFPII